MATRMLDLAIVTPVFNDFEAFWTLCAELSKAAGAMSVIAVFSDIVFVRLLILPSTVSALALALGTGAAGVRVATDFSIPGWASNIVGISAIMLFQAVTLSVVASLTMLASRSGAVFIPAFHAGEYVDERIALSENGIIIRRLQTYRL